MHLEIEREREKERTGELHYFLSLSLSYTHAPFLFGIGTPRSVCQFMVHARQLCVRKYSAHLLVGSDGVDGGKHIWIKYVELRIAFIVPALENAWHLNYFHFFSVEHVNALYPHIYNQRNAWAHTHKNIWKKNRLDAECVDVGHYHHRNSIERMFV